MKNLNQIKKIAILCIYIGFIFSNSLRTADASSVQSGFFVSIAETVLAFFSITANRSVLSFIIRKTAHFTEYFILGLLSQAVFFTQKKSIRKILSAMITVFIPIIDECLQLITPGRSCEIRDMCIDAAGILCGILLFTLLKRRHNTHH